MSCVGQEGMYKPVKIEDVVGLVLAHDVTEIGRGEFKGRAFRKRTPHSAQQSVSFATFGQGTSLRANVGGRLSSRK